MTNCEHFKDGRCNIASLLGNGTSAKTTPQACAACDRVEPKRAINSVTVSLACAGLRAAGNDKRRAELLELYAPLLLSQPHVPDWAHQGWSLTKAVAAFVMKPGFVDDATYDARLSECDVCPQRSQLRCSICGCFVHTKARLPQERCPVYKWDVVTSEGEGE